MRKISRVVLALLVAAPLLAAGPVASASGAPAAGGASAPAVTAGGDPLPYIHHNFFRRVEVVIVNDVSRPIFRTSRTPILADRREYRVVRYDPVYEVKTINIYGERSVSVRVGTRSIPVYATRTVRQIEGWRNTPVWETRSVCVERWRSTCVRWGTERYIERYISEPVWGTRTETYVSGYISEPVYETRTERYVKDTVTIRQQVGTTPVMAWVTVCSLCEIEGYSETRILVGYEQKPLEQLVGNPEELMRCRASGPNGDCGAKSRRFYSGAWWDYVGHSDSYAPRWEDSRSGAGFADCPTGQIRTLDGTTCITPESEPVTVCRWDGTRFVAVLTVQSSVFATDKPFIGGTCDGWNPTTTTLPPAPPDSPTTTLPSAPPDTPSTTTIPGTPESPVTTVPSTAPRRPVAPS